MIPQIDVATLSPQAQKIVAPTAPEKLQEVAARGVAPGIRPAEIVSILVLLSASPRASVRDTAQKTLGGLPDQLLAGALLSELHPLAIDALARAYIGRIDVLEKLVAMPGIAIDTIEELAKSGTEAVTELVATNEDRLLRNPHVIELLYLNKHTRMSTADRLVELAVRNGIELGGIPAWKEVATAIQDELIPEPSPEPTPDDLLFQETQALSEQLTADVFDDTCDETEDGQEVVKEKFLPLYKRLGDMTISQKIRRATLGSKEERALLVRDRNRLVASAAIRSPMIQEDEVMQFSRNRNLSEDVLRIIATTPEWMKSYVIKKNLVENPKTPVMIATRLITQLREADLRHIAKSKNVSGAIQDAARRHLDRRKH